METIRKPFQGVRNIIVFNWHFYFGAAVLTLFLSCAHFIFESIPLAYFLIPAGFICIMVLVSLLVSTYIYDLSGLYSLNWIDRLSIGQPDTVINVNAGFDETTPLLISRYSEATFQVLDFYDPEKHTEVSIKRARRSYPPMPGTLKISTAQIPLENESTDVIFAILSAHEIRNDLERIGFFKELHRILKRDGRIIITEHLRDLPNFLAYTLGFFHFHSKKTWRYTFVKANLQLSEEIKITPFLTTFVVQHA